ncbi:hypothetical protein FA13DRAFT_1749018 [Coprinellus micaceus]|uniref:Cupredoxin n=1 Tax=Coprinellus micaceus TaxID=71717 RepID=A0A4Y7RMN6_COPMI|nr:hypothetical protein FA13DRAFT_1749018 [Coprinellus micaceus]
MLSSTLALSLAALLPTTFAAILEVSVGANGQLAYDPPFVHAAAGDIVRFTFNPKNHTVTQSAFDPPCVPLPEGGFRTGFIPVAAGTDPLPVQEFTVPDNYGAPLWFYCGQVNHCGSGMVFAINPPADAADPHSFEAFRALAIARNGTDAAAPTSTTVHSGAAAATGTDSYTTPPAPHWTEATATVIWGGSTYTTTYTSYDGTPEPTPAVAPQEHKITVGADGKLEYSPANITAAIGDTVVFEFRPKNHTVTQSSFSNPCSALATGFKSGFQPVAADATDFPKFTITINDTAPIWGYCGQVNHCQSGMVFSINAVESGPNNFAAFQQLASRPSGSSSSTDSGSTGGAGNGAIVTSPRVGLAVGTLALASVLAAFL